MCFKWVNKTVVRAEKKIEGHSQQPAANSGEDEGDLDDAEMKKER